MVCLEEVHQHSLDKDEQLKEVKCQTYKVENHPHCAWPADFSWRFNTKTSYTLDLGRCNDEWLPCVGLSGRLPALVIFLLILETHPPFPGGRPFSNTCRALSTKNGLTLYKQLLRPILNYACPAWGHLADTYMRRMQTFQSVCLRIIMNAPWCVMNETLHRDLDMPTIKNHFRKLAQSFYDRLPGDTNPFIQGLGNYVIDPIGNFAKCDNPSVLGSETTQCDQLVGNHDVWYMALDDFLSLLNSCLSQDKSLAFPARAKIKPWRSLSRTKEEGQCSCALFANQNITGIESLLSKEIPLNITCGTEGQAICNSTCVSLVQAVKDKGPIILCGTLKRHNVGLKKPLGEIDPFPERFWAGKQNSALGTKQRARTYVTAPFVFAKACTTGKWVYTGLAGKKPICCHEGKPLPCA
ncbi:unnamed protein product [Timema podura]|uniref:Uncharacterized protein n=1 Tax=Timema podura TaxID=61482 RepID=A0ABN7NMI7_TIMPD|nr:unnamed protein product [Timema podura]